MRNAHCSTWVMVRKLKNMENETQTLQDLEYSEKHKKTWNKGNAHCRTCTMVRKLKIMENEKHTLQHQDYGKKTEKRGK